MLKIKWLGQGGYILNDGITEIIIDPYLTDVVFNVAGRKRQRPVPVEPEDVKADVVVCTHNHLDHIDTEAIPRMKKDNMLFLAPSDCEEVLKNLGVTKYKSFDEGDSLKIGDFEIIGVYANHTVPATGVLIKHSGQSLYFTGDTLYDEKLTQTKCDILFICINGRLGNMSVMEAIETTVKINPHLAVPNHYDMFDSNMEDPEKFTVPQSFIMEFNKEYEVKGKCLI